MRQSLLKFANKSPFFQRLFNIFSLFKSNLFNPQEFPPGHYYSPIPLVKEIKEKESKIFNFPNSIPSVDLNEEEQIRLLKIFKQYYDEMPFKPNKEDGLRYYFENQYYLYSDAIFLYSMIRHTKPKNIVEVGSGHSSCVILDTNEIYFNNKIACTFIEPYPDRFISLIKKSDIERIKIIKKDLQDIDLSLFQSLSENDILFIDSTHISKIHSDVNYIFFDILPNLNKGVYIHFHDIFYPFEYPREWIFRGRAWNEAYMLRSFLQYNNKFKIVFFNTYMAHTYKSKFMEEYPLCMKNTGGSIWLKKC